MGNQPIETSIKMRVWVEAAVAEGVCTVKELRDYFIDNGWEGDLPSDPTLYKLLNKALG